LQEKTRKLEENARMVGLKINAKKTKLMYLNTERLPVIFVYTAAKKLKFGLL
jgi:hypothetical protein